MQHCIGHRSRGKYVNAYNFEQVDGEWIVRMELNLEHAMIFDIADLDVVLNLQDSHKGIEREIPLSDNLKGVVYRLDNSCVPTWRYDAANASAGVTGKYPARDNTKTKTQSLGRLLLGLTDRGSVVQYRNQDRFDLRRQNLYIAGNAPAKGSKAKSKAPTIVERAASATEREWDLPTNPETHHLTEPLVGYKIVESIPGSRDPSVNPYDLVEYQGIRFYRMRAIGGEVFYFSPEDLSRVLKVEDVEFPSWFKTAISSKGSESYIACAVKSKVIPLHTYLFGRHVGTDDKLTVDHINWNKWDNRRCNLRLATQSEQNANRAKRPEIADRNYGTIPKARYPPYTYYDPAKGAHGSGFVVQFPLSALPHALARVVRENLKGKAKYQVRTTRDKRISDERKLEHAHLLYNALKSGSYFGEDGSVNALLVAEIESKIFGKRFPAGVPHTVPKIEWIGNKTDWANSGSWRMARAHPFVKDGSVKRISVATKEYGTPEGALIELYCRMIEQNPSTSPLPQLAEKVAHAMQCRKKRSPEHSVGQVKRAKVE